ncbi:hypothetical protein DSM106972_005500 [Dulcicalothrix desertica PCC 7102]|uniref:NYN domain-containing protein n=1 Tax=Dulcicalothrix desertica PCC 7102 TaxID=232991 RepID=A0A3S1J997_9CYAN|nr:NYN domain-containing protein [Dulcicalothrix desertica]RUT10055.1 hypothetical protein DSM106972_005500 [Dulcicalothrix desertica PCC 7102]
MATPLSTKQSSVSIYCDYQNVNLNEKTVSLLQDFANSIGTLLTAKLYYNPLVIRKFLEFHNITCIDVPCSLPNSVDYRISNDIIKDIRQAHPDTIIIVSGDGDFIDLVEILKYLGKHVIVIAQSGNVNARLIQSANQFYYLNDLQQLMEKPVTSEASTQVTSSELSYREAIKYLIRAVKTALSQNKSTGLGYINDLMRKSFPSYQGCHCIRTDNGIKFSRFKKFIEAVVSDGKIIMKDNQLFLA